MVGLGNGQMPAGADTGAGAGGGTRTASRRTSLPTGRRPAVVPDLDDGARLSFFAGSF